MDFRPWEKRGDIIIINLIYLKFFINFKVNKTKKRKKSFLNH